MQGSTIKFAGFIGLSIIAHGLLLIVQKQHETYNSQPPLGQQMLSITLAINDQSTIESEANKNVNTVIKANTEKKQLVHVQKELIESSKSRQSEDYATDLHIEHSSKPGVANLNDMIEEPVNNLTSQALLSETNNQSTTVLQKKAQQSAQRNFLLGEIHNRLSQYMNYPARARKRGWEGSVTVGLFIDKQGNLRNIRLTQTSGYALLDNAAVTAVKKVNQIPVNQLGSIFQPIALQLPVIYRLTNG